MASSTRPFAMVPIAWHRRHKKLSPVSESGTFSEHFVC